MCIRDRRIAIGSLSTPIEEIKQETFQITQDKKYHELINQLVERNGSILVFVKTKRGADKIVKRLKYDGHSADAIHGNLRQSKRDRVINNFRNGKSRILIATDVAARGLDIPLIKHVINYDLPDDTEVYVHRIGRTGRMGRRGESWSFVSGKEVQAIDRICSTWGLTIPFVEPPSLPAGVERDFVPRRDDWEEVSDAFGMVCVRMSLGGSEKTRREIVDWIISEARIPEIAIGETYVDSEGLIVEVHVEKVAYVIDVIKGRKMDGVSLNPKIVNA